MLVWFLKNSSEWLTKAIEIQRMEKELNERKGDWAPLIEEMCTCSSHWNACSALVLTSNLSSLLTIFWKYSGSYTHNPHRQIIMCLSSQTSLKNKNLISKINLFRYLTYYILYIVIYMLLLWNCSITKKWGKVDFVIANVMWFSITSLSK